MRHRVLIVINSEWFFVSHRLALARTLRASGYDVVICAPVERGEDSVIINEGLRFVPIDLRRRSIGLRQELRTLIALYRLYRRERPDLVHHVTIKPIIHGSFAARAAGVPAVINAISGRGEAFIQPGVGGALLRWGLTVASRFACSGARTRVIFQNPEDREWFVKRGGVPIQRTALIRGAGVDVDRFCPTPVPAGTPIVLLASRLLWNKGIGEFVEASRLLRRDGVQARFALVGLPDDGNPNSIPLDTIKAWQAEGVIEWWGLRNDMPDVLRSASIVALPTTYPEGLPKILLEAAACGRPIVATNAPGCREVVVDGANGLLVPPRDAGALAQAIAKLLANPELATRMGIRGRQIVLDEFTERQTIAATLAVYAELLRDVAVPGISTVTDARPLPADVEKL